jgi:hypothetical protein
MLADQGIAGQLFGPDQAHIDRVVTQYAVGRIVGDTLFDQLGDMLAFLPRGAVHRPIAAAVAPPGELAPVTLLVTALLDDRTHPARPAAVGRAVQDHMSDGNLADHRARRAPRNKCSAPDNEFQRYGALSFAPRNQPAPRRQMPRPKSLGKKVLK